MERDSMSLDSIIFLDVDGVLNTHSPLCPHVMCGQIHDDKAAILKRIILTTKAQIVLSSAWRYLIYRDDMNLVGLNWLFRSHGIPGVIFGITREDTMVVREPWDGSQPWPVSNERGRQIADWVRINEFSGKYVVIDDMDLGISEMKLPFVQTDPRNGLTEIDAERAIEFLGCGATEPCCDS